MQKEIIYSDNEITIKLLNNVIECDINGHTYFIDYADINLFKLMITYWIEEY